MSGSITGATAAYQLSVRDLYDDPQLLQGFAADDVFSTPAIKSVETMMGVDGFLSGGFVFTEIVQSISLQADSDSNDIFDNWWASMQAQEEVFIGDAVIVLKALGRKWTMTRGFLTSYSPIPDTKKLIQPRKYEITWNLSSPSPV
jgi:hypothetical protein